MALTRIANIASTIPDDSIANVKMANIVQSKNIIINGDMSVAQRATSVTGNTAGGYLTCDRWNFNIGSAGTWTATQSTDVPTGQGFATSFKLDCTTADASLGSGDIMQLQQRFEGQNLQYLLKGTASAKSLTLSFWTKSNKTGTYIAEFRDRTNNRTISQTYTISSADTWEKKTLTYAGDTTGALANTNANILQLNLWLAAGSNYSSGSLATSWGTRTDANRAVGQVNLADSTSNDFYITGIQLEAGTTASDFEFLPVDVNLQRCQRYYYLHNAGASLDVGVGGYYNSSQIFLNVQFPTSMRTSPSLEQVTGSAYYSIYRQNTADDFNSLTLGQKNENIVSLYNNSEVSGTAGDAGFIRTNNSSTRVAFDSEL